MSRRRKASYEAAGISPSVIDLMDALVASLKQHRDAAPPAESSPAGPSPAGFTGPCPACGSTTCASGYKPDANHELAF
jgi:hypothetical protein